jgi:DNA-binding LytR/AlgR family response regulator
MIRIAIVEDDESTQKIITEYINKFGNEKNYEFSVNIFSNGQDFINNCAAQFDLVFMDIEMPKMSGLTAARQLRKLDNDAVLIFITNLAQYAINGYEVDALGYILKPIKYFTFAHNLEKAVALIKRKEGKYIIFKVDGEFKKVHANNIVYLEAFGHEITCHTILEDLRITNTLNEMEKQLTSPPFHFLRAHRSILVNPIHVKEVTANSIIVNGNVELPLSKGQRKSVLSAIMKNFGDSD